MRFTILIPHFKAGKMTAYAVSQFLKCRGRHDVKIVIIDNSPTDGSARYLEPFRDSISYHKYPEGKLQSHGIAFDYALKNGLVEDEYFITAESDSFPTDPNWLDYYEKIAKDGVDCAGSVMRLSGGTYLHPAGAMYRREVWEKAYDYASKIPYAYFPNMAAKEGFDCHLMVKKSFVNDFLKDPEKFVELAEGYKPYSEGKALERLAGYDPVGSGVFHNGMGSLQESIHTYGQRSLFMGGPEDALITDRGNTFIHRIGYEPGQYFCYWIAANDYLMRAIPTEVKWLPGKENQQQEYTINSAGFKHIWGVSAYHDVSKENSVAAIKQDAPEKLYETLPNELKIIE